jgi:hypothetical protein
MNWLQQIQAICQSICNLAHSAVTRVKMLPGYFSLPQNYFPVAFFTNSEEYQCTWKYLDFKYFWTCTWVLEQVHRYFAACTWVWVQVIKKINLSTSTSIPTLIAKIFTTTVWFVIVRLINWLIDYWFTARSRIFHNWCTLLLGNGYKV